MFYSNQDSNVFNKFFGLTPWLTIGMLFFFIVLSVESVLTLNNKAKHMETINLWMEDNEKNPKYKALFEEPIGNIHEKMKDISQYIKRGSENGIERDREVNINLLDPSKNQSISWKLKKDGSTIRVNYQGGSLRESPDREDLDLRTEATTETEELTHLNLTNLNLTKREEEIFIDFVEKIKFEIYQELESISEKEKLDKNKHFQEYSNTVLKHFLNLGTYDYQEQLPNLRATYIYIANEIGVLVQYPAKDNSNNFNFRERPWWKATKGIYVSHFIGNNPLEPTNQWGITGSYVDINDQDQSLTLVRTVWHKFTDPDTGKKYVLCLDLFFDTDQKVPLKANLNIPYLPIKITLPFFQNIFLDSLLISIGLTFFSFWIYKVRLKEIVLRWIALLQEYSRDSLTIKLKRLKDRRFASKGNDNTGTIRVSYTLENLQETEQQKGVGWHISSKHGVGVQASRSTDHSRTHRTVSLIQVDSVLQYTLNLKEDDCPKCLEIWEVTLEPKNQVICVLVAEWINTVNPTITKQLDIKFISWEKKYERHKDSIKEELLNHLLGNEEKEYLTIIGRNSLVVQDNIPNDLKNIDGLTKTIETLNYLKQRRFIFPEITMINELYKLGKLKGVCNQSLLKLLIDDGGETLKKFIGQYNKVFWVEEEQETFQSFYANLDANTQQELSGSSLQPIVYSQNIKSKNFCLFEINKIVIDIYTDDRYAPYAPIGSFSCSWRDVDIRFYNELFEMLEENGTVLHWSSLI